VSASAAARIRADDTTLYDIGDSRQTIENNLQTTLDSLSNWCKCNGMLINTTQTKVMLITTHQKRARLTSEILILI
jgi:hypothetical protein